MANEASAGGASGGAHRPRALVSVSDKRGVVAFARGLVSLGFEVVSTGGTLQALTDAGVAAVSVSDVTGFPEILGGRVKTLHPAVHGGILAKREVAHQTEAAAHGIGMVDVVAVNLYPFRQTVAKPDVTWDEALEQIDIGGPTMVRAAAKNHPAVVVVVDPDDYESVLTDLDAGFTLERRRALAVKAFAHTAAYDAAIVAWMQRDEPLPRYLGAAMERVDELRYGENPHQIGARYREVGAGGFWDEAVQHSGMALSYLNLFDAEAAWRLAHDLGEGRACVIVKHANPCGAAVGQDLAEAYAKAFDADPKSAFGGVVALPGTVDEALAQAIVANPKADVLLALGYAPEALALFARKRKNMRVLEAPAPGTRALEWRRLDGGFLVQQPDRVTLDRSAWRVVTKKQPTDEQWRDVEVAQLVCAATSSNAIVLVSGGSAVGVGAGQQSRVDAVEIAARKADGRAAGGVCASDAFFPFRDGVDAAAAAGVAVVVQPGGSIADETIIAAADELGLAMVMTGERHFRH
ncbi:MAG: bifunctional phosphoribosylaminoimidazolecarboxamide formyltransferase/IMP cyclohydrolase [Trueperaceae bacterium]